MEDKNACSCAPALHDNLTVNGPSHDRQLLSTGLFSVSERVSEHVADVVVDESVVDVAAHLSGVYQPGLTQYAELVAHGGLGDVEGFDQRVDAHLPLPQKAEDTQASRIGEPLEEANRLFNHVRFR